MGKSGKRYNKRSRPFYRDRKRNEKSNGERPQDWSSELVKENAKFREFYLRQGVVSPSNVEKFLEALRQPLPTTFRINRATGCAKQLHERLQRDDFGLAQVAAAGLGTPQETFTAPQCHAWYPHSMLWSCSISNKLARMGKRPGDDPEREAPVPEETVELRARVRRFRKWLIEQNERGHVNRQEAVSMLPPLLLDVRPGHMVFDSCAAPGSKTQQILEALHMDGDRVLTNPQGFVVANDANVQRAQLLTHQLKRCHSGSFMVVNHEAQNVPTPREVQVPGLDGEATEARQVASTVAPRKLFDRVLLDVPCSGDGTMRKNVELWRDWTQHNGNALHAVQMRIAMRGVQLLKPGGRLVYSTCSFHPCENEAVVAHLMLRAKEELGHELELVDVSAELPGLERAEGLQNWQVQDKDGTWYTSFDQVGDKERCVLKATHFPPPTEVTQSLHLERCLRILPHLQDTGGFFVAVLQSKKTVETETAEAPMPTLEAFVSQLPCNAPRAARVAASETETDENGEERKRVRKQAYSKNKPPQDRLIHVASYMPAEVRRMQAFYGFAPVDSVPQGEGKFDVSHLFTRSEQAKRLYVVSESMARVLARPEASALNVLQCGLRAFERYRPKDTSVEDKLPNYRLVQEGLHMLLPHMTKQRAPVPLDDLRTMMAAPRTQLSMDKLTSQATEAIAALDNGSIVLEADVPSDVARHFARPLAVVAWKADKVLRLMVSKEDLADLQALLDDYLSQMMPASE